ncbi:STAS domain-containing protein [Noviherbaspirillum galbum]|uniref:STAS domain-containing protein n=1 Tax=Noviherbaspirillum galbum TaxID=2709383 RepID=A0A6B3SS78_9BURK|nr:STAS domain-containing protein [Noviherbaspirillum galbum]NEX61302.1 STAS domain-containing protein [Noviherbaspirillum galbum]
MQFRPGLSLTFNNAKTVLEAGSRAVADGQTDIDLGELTAVDSAAVATLLAWKRLAAKAGRSLAFHHASPNLQSLIALYGVGDILGITASVPAAASAASDQRHRA